VLELLRVGNEAGRKGTGVQKKMNIKISSNGKRRVFGVRGLNACWGA